MPAPPGDAIVSISCSISSEEFIVGTRKGALLTFRKNGILREISHTSEAIN